MSFNGFTVASEVEIRPACHPDGVSDNTAALQAAIDQAAAVGNESCQGVVLLEPGVWRSGPLEMKSYVTLRFSAQTTLKALTEKDFVAAYIGAPSQPHEALIHAHGVTRCAIEGPEGLGEPSAVIDGTGEHWWPAAIEARGWLKNGEVERFTQAFPGIVTANGMPRPWLIELSWCSQVKMSGIKLTQSPMWTLVVRNSNEVLLEGLWVINPEYAPNTDGIDWYRAVTSRYGAAMSTPVMTILRSSRVLSRTAPHAARTSLSASAPLVKAMASRLVRKRPTVLARSISLMSSLTERVPVFASSQPVIAAIASAQCTRVISRCKTWRPRFCSPARTPVNRV